MQNEEQGTFDEHGLTLIPACQSNHMPSKVWDGNICPIPNLHGYMGKQSQAQ